MTLARAQWRTAAAWHAYDRANFWVLVGLFFAFVVWMLWQQTQPPSRLEPPLADSPVRMQRTPAPVEPLELRVVGARLVLTGAVPDNTTRGALKQAGEAAFGAGQVDDWLTVSAAAGPADWRDHLPDMMRTLRGTGGAAALRIDGRRVTLAGEVPQDSTRAAHEMMVLLWFGRSAQVDNQLRVAAAPAPAVPPTAVASAAGLGTVPAGGASAAVQAAPAGPAVPAACAALVDGLAVRFHPNAAALTDDGRRILRELLPCLAEGRWRVGVHTDSNGDPAANVALTQGRAEAVVNYLVGRKLPADRLVAVGYGASRPLVGNDTPQDRLKNRRVTFERQP